MMSDTRLVVDTNVFVAAGFKRASHSARIVGLIRTGDLDLVWDAKTRREIEHTVGRIPVLSNAILDDLFREKDFFDGTLNEGEFEYISDPADRKFAALAVAAGVSLISSDNHLLAWRDRIPVLVMTPSEFMRGWGRGGK